MATNETLHATESKIAQDLKTNPQNLSEVYKELRKLRLEDPSQQAFAKDLSIINKDLHDLNILPNFELTEDPTSADGFSLRPSQSADETPSNERVSAERAAAGNSGGDGSGGGGGGSGGGDGGGGGSDGYAGGGRGGGGGSDGARSSGENLAADQTSAAPSDLPSDVPSGSLAAKIVQAGENVGGNEGTVGLCLKGVEDSLQSVGINMPRRNYASDMAPDFAKDTKNFQEVNANGPLKPGDIIVHGGTASNPAGHIAIVLPNGQESSDHKQALISTAVTASFGPSRVFRPIS